MNDTILTNQAERKSDLESSNQGWFVTYVTEHWGFCLVQPNPRNSIRGIAGLLATRREDNWK